MCAQSNLPRLAFGEGSAARENSLSRYRDALAAVIPTIQSVDPLGPTQDFRFKSCTVNLRGVTLVASANSPMHSHIGAPARAVMQIPFAGRSDSRADGPKYVWEAGKDAIFIPRIERAGSCTLRSVVTIALSVRRMRETAAAMLGRPRGEGPDLDLERARLCPFQFGGYRFETFLRPLCQQLDALHDAPPEALEMLGTADLVYRNVCLLVAPQLFLAEPGVRAPPAGRARLDMVCDHVLGYLEEPITLTMLEAISGLSRRTLQNGFQERFGMSPGRWIRQQRLELARRKLLAAEPGTRVTDIALSLGFGKPSAFALHYRQAYGETPSQTLARVKGGI